MEQEVVANVKKAMESGDIHITKLTDELRKAKLPAVTLKELAALAHKRQETMPCDYCMRGHLNTLAVWLDIAGD